MLPALLLALLPQAPAAAPGPAEILLQDWLVLAAVDERGRRPFRPDAVFRTHLLERGAPPPTAGQAVSGSLGGAEWEARAVEDGWVRRVAWAHTTVELPAARVMMAELQGASTLFVNGDGFVGDHYRFGHGGVPVALREGRNEIYVTGVRGGFRLRLWTPEGRVQVGGWSVRRPDLVVGQPVSGEASVAVMNASTELLDGVRVEVGGAGPFGAASVGLVGPLPPLHATRAVLPLRPRAGHPLPPDPAAQELPFRVGAVGEEARPHGLALDMRLPEQARRRTYRSRVDGAVTEFSLLPPAGGGPADGLVLSLHGAGVASWNQASSYAPKEGFWLAAPTNRAPFGFDWQDWGRIDALEVLDLVLSEQQLDPRRVMITGHSMGGHGTWSLSVNDPDRFAAVAPSAGWCSFDSYVGRPEGALRELWHAADGSSDTLARLDNLRGKPVYILHGDADDNVPASEGEAMAGELEARGIAHSIHLEPGAGHWWTDDRYPGAECMDWPPIFAMFEEARLPAEPTELDWRSVGPEVDAEHFWLRVEQPERYGEPMRVQARHEADPGAVVVETENVRTLWIGVPHTLARIDRQDFLADPEARGAWYRRVDGRWQQAEAGAPAGEKRPERSGPFRRAFDRRFVLVFATGGTAEENAESLARARFDAQRWAYRAFGDAELVADHTLIDLEQAGRFAGRNLVLYGNADTNRAWEAVLPADCPLRAERGRLRLGRQEWRGEELGALFCFPRAGEPDALVAAFADTGVGGARLGYTLQPFLSGVGMTDYAVFDAAVLEEGDGGVRAAGWWTAGWKMAAEVD
jgi:dienelactone hydrolase